MKGKRFKFILTTLLILIVLGLIFYPKIKPLIAKNDSNPGSQSGSLGGGGAFSRGLSVQAILVAPSVLNESIISTGTLFPDEEVELSFEASGKIVQINFIEGARVRKGALLAKINDRHLQAQLLKLQAQNKLLKEREFRQKTLLTRDAVSQESYDQVLTELQANEADIMLLEARIAETELMAPFDGIVGLRYVSEGSFANPNIKITRLVKISPIKIEFSIPERYAGSVGPGTNISFVVDGTLQPMKATIYAIDPKVDVKTRTIVARALFPNRNEELKPGRFASITLILEELKDAIAIPTEALIAEMDGDVVFVYKNGKAQRVNVRTGLRTATQIQVLKGLSFGDTLLTTGVMQLRQGIPVTITNLVGDYSVSL